MKRVRLKEEITSTLPLPLTKEQSLFVPGMGSNPISRLKKLKRERLFPHVVEEEEEPKIKSKKEEPKKKIERVRLRDLVLGADAPSAPVMSGKPESWCISKKLPFEPSNEQRRFVELAVTNGANRQQIAAMIENPSTGKAINVKTLDRAFSVELKYGHVKQRLELSGTVYKEAVGRAAEFDDKGNLIISEKAPNFAAAKWYEQSRFGLKEGQQIVFTDNEGKAIQSMPGSINIGQVVFMLPKNGYESKVIDITPEKKVLPAPIEEEVDG